jgi:Putative peptidoglycan binding domain
MEVFVDRKHFLKRGLLIGLITALPAVVNAASPGGGGHSGGGGHAGGGFHGGSVGGGRPGYGGRGAVGQAGYLRGNRYAYAGNANSWHGNGGSWHGNGDWRHGDNDFHHHHRFSFGFFPYWYPGWGYYDWGYPYYADYGYDYPDYYYPDNGYYSGQNGSSGASIEVLVQSALARRGYYEGQVDGVIGPGTRSAIREFQRDNGLQVTGRIDSQTVQALRKGRD